METDQRIRSKLKIAINDLEKDIINTAWNTGYVNLKRIAVLMQTTQNKQAKKYLMNLLQDAHLLLLVNSKNI